MLTRLIRLAATVSLLTAALSVPTKAQVVVHGTYYEELKFIQCLTASISACAHAFSALPQDTLMTKVTCVIETNGALDFVEFGVSDASSGENLRRAEILPLPMAAVNGTIRRYSVVAATGFLFGTSKYPTVLFHLDGMGSFSKTSCKIYGTLQ